MPRISDSPPAVGPSVLDDPLFTVDCNSGTESLALPELLTRLLIRGGGVDRFTRVAAEQHGPVWRFLVRCAAEALHTLERDLPPHGSDATALAGELGRVLAMRAGGAGAWQLYESDVRRPAFLQPPVPESGSAADAGFKLESAARLGLAVGAKNHERKVEAGREMDAEALVFALITFQGGVIYTKGNYASQLMGSASGKGSGSPFMAARLDGSLDTTFRHDVRVLLDAWDDIRRERGLRGKVWALWAEPWDGETPLPASRLDPAFIPCARLVRIAEPVGEDRWSAIWLRSTRKARVADHTEGSGLGDPFLPVVPSPKRPGDVKVRGAMGTGYRYDEVVRLLFGDASGGGVPAPSARALLDERPPEGARIRFEGMAFDQGKTLGFHHREILVPEGNFIDLEEPDAVRALHGRFLNVVKEAQSALRGATRILLRGSAAPRANDRARVEAGAEALQAAVDAEYIERLLEAAIAERASSGNVMASWRAWVRRQALLAFEAVVQSVPTSTTTQYQRRILAEAFLKRKLGAP